MADESGAHGPVPPSPGVISLQDGEVFINGDSQNGKKNSLLLPGDSCCGPDMPIPRRSSLVKDGSRRTNRKKTVSFSSSPAERKIVNVPDCLTFMQNGSELLKVRSNSRQYHRLFTLDKNLTEIRWQPTSKKPHKARIGLDQIKEVRVGKNTEVLRNQEIAGFYPDECAFSIIYGDQFDSLDLIASTPDEANIWLTGLTCLISSGKRSSSADEVMDDGTMRDRWLEEVFAVADEESVGSLDEYDVIELVKKLNKQVTTRQIQQKMKELELDRTDQDQESAAGRLTATEFASVYKELSTRPEIYFLLVRYSSHSDCMSVDDLKLFLEAEQGMTRVSQEKCMEIIQKFEPSNEGKEKGFLGVDGFTAYLVSEECDLFDPEHLTVCQDMSQPLSHYFIASSHNTYLMQDQLKGPSSVDAYVQSLMKGCRYIEADCWDGTNDEPVVYHGHTLTSKIPFKSVLEAIKAHAFRVSDYPVILSIENHCSPKQQYRLVEYLKAVLGEKLFTQIANNHDERLFLPSPEMLKGKIILKGKKLSENDTSEGYVTDEEKGADADRKKTSKRSGPDVCARPVARPVARSLSFERLSFRRKRKTPCLANATLDSVKKQKLIRELSDLVIYCKSIRFEDFHVSQTKQRYYELCSFSESCALKLANAFPEDFVNYNKRFLSRVYPNGMRVDSSNFNPQDLWNCGSQIVAMNYQTPGLMMDLNSGHFRKNGGCGYVLKPAIMRERISYFSANTREVIPGVDPQVLHVKIISGYQLPKPKLSGAKGDTTDPYVTVEIFGIPADCAEERTKTVPHNGLNPIFDESFEFLISLPELALVRFAVLDDEYIGDEFIGQYSIPFECMQSGYRHINLFSNTGEPLDDCLLFVHIAMTNKRGGGRNQRHQGRHHRRGSDTIMVKTIGIKQLDDTFKTAINPLREASDLRENVQVALSTFKESCGLSPISNMKQCIRMLASRISTWRGTDNDLKLIITVKAEYPSMEAHGNVPDILRKALIAFHELVCHCRSLVNMTDTLAERMLDSQRAGLECYEELPHLCQLAGLKGRKLAKATENFAWTIRVLKGQADLLQQARKECKDYMQQVIEAAVATGLCTSEQPPAS